MARVAWDEHSARGAILRGALLPASALFRLASRIHHGLYDGGIRGAERADMPVLSIGNLRVGGAGKTPFAGWVVGRLLALGRRPAVLHGGYGSDEPELHRRWHPSAPVFEGRDRAASVGAARAAGCDVAVLDDGFQHRRLARDLDIVLLAAEHGAERVRLLPRGPWREPLSALRRAHAVVVTRKTASAEEARTLATRIERDTGTRPAVAFIRADRWVALRAGTSAADADGAAAMDATPGGAVVAVAAIAEPDSFFDTLASMGVPLVARRAYPDHHVYSPADLDEIARAAAGRVVATTAKDAVKLGALAERADVRVLEQRVTIEAGEAELLERITRAVT